MPAKQKQLRNGNMDKYINLRKIKTKLRKKRPFETETWSIGRPLKFIILLFGI
jgi:hypothetical protein